jgi:hypothetical protein
MAGLEQAVPALMVVSHKNIRMSIVQFGVRPATALLYEQIRYSLQLFDSFREPGLAILFEIL